MQPLAGHVARQTIHVIGDLAIGKVIQQRLARLVAALACGQKQRRLVLVVLCVAVRMMHQQYVHRLRVVHSCSPMQRRLAGVVRRIDVRIRCDQILDHALNCQPSGQYEGRGAVMHACIQIGGTIAQQYLKDAHGIGRDSSMQWCPSRVILTIGIGTGVEQSLGGIGPSITCGQVKRSLARLVHGGIQLGSLGQQIGDHLRRAVLVVLNILATVQAATADGSNHQWGEPAGTTCIHVVFATILMCWRCHYGTHICHIQMRLRPDTLICLLVLTDHRMIAGIAHTGQARHTAASQATQAVGQATGGELIATLALCLRHIGLIVGPMTAATANAAAANDSHATGQLMSLRLAQAHHLLVQITHLLAMGIATAP